MHLPTSKLSILVVEDDNFKLERVKAHLNEVITEDFSIAECGAMSTAADMLNAEEYDIVVIDMSIPSHPTAVGAGSPYSFPSGGLDVLFGIEDLKHRSICIVLTQYPEIEIEGILVPVDQAGEQIFKKFGIRVSGCIQYLEDGLDWKLKMNKYLGL